MCFQMMTMWRGGLVSFIYKRTMELDASVIKDSAPVTLMSTDIDGIAMAIIGIHDVWASILEIPLGVYLLSRQVGLSSLLLLIPGLCECLLRRSRRRA